MIKKFLNKKSIQFREINISKHPEKQQEAFNLSGALTVPITVVENETEKQVIVGFNLPQLIPAIS